LPIEAITQHVYDHLVERGTPAGLSRSWYNVIFHALASWLGMRRLPTELRGLRPKRIRIQSVRWFRAHEASALMAGIEQLRYRTLFMTMLGTGMRIRGVRMLRVTDVDRERPLIQVRDGKGGDGRYVRCEPTLRRILCAQWQRWRVVDLLFPHNPGSPRQPMEPATLNAALRRSAERCGVAVHRGACRPASMPMKTDAGLAGVRQQCGYWEALRQMKRWRERYRCGPMTDVVELRGRGQGGVIHRLAAAQWRCDSGQPDILGAMAYAGGIDRVYQAAIEEEAQAIGQE
jgi:hypothetical protein